MQEEIKEIPKEAPVVRAEEPLAGPQPWTVDTVVYVWHNILSKISSSSFELLTCVL